MCICVCEITKCKDESIFVSVKDNKMPNYIVIWSFFIKVNLGTHITELATLQFTLHCSKF